MSRHRIRVVCVLAALAARSATAAPAPTSLNNCQNAVKKATKAFIANKVMAIGTCLQAVSTQIVKNNAPDANAAAGTCVTQFRRINDSRGLDKQLSDKLATAIVKKCAPGQPNVTHTLADIIGAGAGVSQPLDAENLNAWCSHYGGDGSIDTLQEWIDCVAAAAECDVDSTIASQYPRALEWLNLVKPSMQTLSAPVADPTKVTDAVAGLDAVKAEIDGPNNDNVVSIQCGGAPPPPMATGQTTSYAAGDDGALQKGAPRSYTDNGDGTITDNTTGLMWEKKVKLDGATDGTNLHDADNSYPWGGSCTSQTQCNSGGTCCQSSADCVTPHTCTITDGQATGKTIFQWVAQLNTANFAGHNDWRAPNVNELQSIVNYQVSNPSVSAAFQGASCGGACTDITSAACSCTRSNYYWSSSTPTAFPNTAWVVYFYYSNVSDDGKLTTYYVRAVRGGS